MTKSAKDIDYTPLSEPVTPADVAVYLQQFPDTKITKKQLIAGWAGYVFLLLLLSVNIAGDIAKQGTVGLWPWAAGGICFAVLVVIGIGVTYGLIHPDHDEEAKSYKFALKNGMIFTPQSSYIESQTGMIFDNGEGRFLTNIFQLQQASMPIEIGNYQYVTGSGKSKDFHEYGYMRLTLPRHVPHMVLDSQDNNTKVLGVTLSTGMSDAFKNNQVLQLEGDFNNYFRLYCPKEYERDALYIFTPDLMALLIDETATYDVEIVGNDMYIYQNASFPVNDAAVYGRLFQIADVIGAKMHSRTHRYADEKVADTTRDIVSEPGKRLKSGIQISTMSLEAIAFLVVIVILFTWWFVDAALKWNQGR